MKKLLPAVFFLTLMQSLVAQNRLHDNEYFFNLSNGLKLFVREDSTAKDVTAAIAFSCGAFQEDQQFDGMSVLFEKIIAARIEAKLNLPVYSETSLEYVYLGVTTPVHDIKRVLEGIYQCVIAPADSAELWKAAAVSNMLYQQLQAVPEQQLDTIIGSLLWGENFSKRVFISYRSDSAAALLQPGMATMMGQYFCPGNALLIIDGNVNGKDLLMAAGKIFDNWLKCSINLFARFPGYNYKTVLMNTQLVAEDAQADTALLKIAFQGPPPFEGMRNNYCAMLLSNMFEDEGSKLHGFFRDSCHVSAVHLQNDMARYLSQLTFTVAPDAGYLGDGIECFRRFLSGACDSLIDSTEIETAKASVISKMKALKSSNRSNAYLVARYWKSLSLDDYHTIEDTVRSIDTSDMRYFLDHYLRKRRYAAGIYLNPSLRDSSGIDSVFTPTATDISAYRLRFLKNSGRFESAADDSVFNSLVQFLKINPEVNIKVNGMCHETELPEVEDKELRAWVDSLDYFLMNPPTLATKKKFRLDVYRSLTLIRKLIEAGISKDRLFGTANRVRLPDPPEDAQAATFYRLYN